MLFYILLLYNMIPYRSFYLLQHNWNVLILDSDKSIVCLESTLALAKKFIDLVVDSCPSIDAVNEFANGN